MPLYQPPSIPGLTVTGGVVTINDGSADQDFRIESDDNTHMLFVDAGNDRVGIGTSTPISLLDIEGGLTTVGAVLTLSTKETTVVANDVLGRINFQAPLEASGTDAILPGASIHALATDTFAADNNETALVFSTASGDTEHGSATSGAVFERMRITSAGNLQLQNGNSITWPSGSFVLTNGDGTDLTVRAADDLILDAIDDMFFKAGGSFKMTILNTGNVGIGTTAPAAPLHVAVTGEGEAIRLESTDAGGNVAPVMTFKRTSATPVDGDNIGIIQFLAMNSNQDDGAGTEAEHKFADMYARINDVSLDSEDGELYFRTLSGGALKRRLDINALGVVFNEDSLDMNFRVESNGNANMLVVDGGTDRVGIGTLAPDALLHISDATTGDLVIFESTAESSSTADDAPQLVLRSGSSTDGDYIGSIAMSGKTDSGAYANYAKIFGRIDDNANAAKSGGLFAQVMHHNALKTMLWIEGHTSGTGNMTFNYNDQEFDINFFVGSQQMQVFQTSTIKTMGSTLRLYQKSGAGATDNDGSGAALDYYLRHSGGSDVHAGRIGVAWEGDTTGTASTQDAFMAFSTALNGTDAERMRITSAGNVGIGTTSPARTLELEAASNPAIRLQETSQNGYLEIFGLADSQSMIKATNATTGETCMLDIDVSTVSGNNQVVRFFRNSNTASAGIIQVHDPGETSVTLAVVAANGKTSIGTGTVDNNSMLTVEGAISLDEISAPTNTAARGQLYTNADNELHMVDGAGVDAIFLKGGKHSIWVPATAMKPTTTAGCSALTTLETTAGRPDMTVLDFATGSTEFAQFNIAMPANYAHGTAITFQVYWAGIAATTGVSWALSATSITNNTGIDLAFAGPVQLVDDAQGAVEELNISAESGNVAVKNAAAGALTYFQFSRDHDESGDDMNGDARLLGIKVFYTVDKGNEA